MRSTTFTFTLSSNCRNWLGDNSPSQITVSAPVCATTCRNSLTFPDPINVAESGLSRLCIKPSRTSDPAVSASAANSRREFSASVLDPSVHTPTRTTRSKRSCRFSAIETSSSSVEIPTTLRSERRSSSSS
ncbi:unannotated protein [freshwater metagenome]|uniref:Unannotated protein n=1 Tax=freshwater metagenome TaxID=449393 RepID=A0A6J7UL62_9ZZZZ